MDYDFITQLKPLEGAFNLAVSYSLNHVTLRQV